MHVVRSFILALLVTTLPAGAQEPQIESLSSLDRQWMARQRELIDEIGRLGLGRGVSGDRERDLELLQALLDRGLVEADQTEALQAMGLILGDHLAADLDLDWVIYKDALGRSRALRDGDSDRFLFPMTMISRRREVGNETPVAEIYNRARATIVSNRPKLPFR